MVGLVHFSIRVKWAWVPVQREGLWAFTAALVSPGPEGSGLSIYHPSHLPPACCQTCIKQDVTGVQQREGQCVRGAVKGTISLQQWGKWKTSGKQWPSSKGWEKGRVCQAETGREGEGRGPGAGGPALMLPVDQSPPPSSTRRAPRTMHQLGLLPLRLPEGLASRKHQQEAGGGKRKGQNSCSPRPRLQAAGWQQMHSSLKDLGSRLTCF